MRSDERHVSKPARRRGRDVVPDVLGLLVLLETRLSELPAEAGLLVAAPLRLGDVGVVVVDPDRAHAHPGRDPLPLAGVLGPDRAGQAVDRVVGDPDRVVLVGEGLDGEHGTEGLVLHDAHPAAYAAEHGRLEEVAVGQLALGRPLAADEDLCSLGDPRLDVRRDLVEVLLGDQRTCLGLLVEGTTQSDVTRPLDELGDELLGDGLLDHQPRTGRADLAGVEEHRGHRHVEGGRAVGVGEDDVGVLAAQLEGDLLHGAGRRGHDALAGAEPTGERDEVDARVLAQRGSCVGTVAEDEVGDTGGEPGLVEQPHQVDRGVRRELARLEHERAARGQRGRHLPGDLEQRVVPRRDQPADADRLAHDPAHHTRHAGVDDAPALGIGRPAEVPEDAGHVVDVDLALDEALAGVEGLHPGHLGLVALEEVGHPEEQVTPLAGAGARPVALVEGGAGRRDGSLGVDRRGLVDLGDELAVGRTADLAATAFVRGHPRPADEVLGHPGPSPLPLRHSQRARVM